LLSLCPQLALTSECNVYGSNSYGNLGDGTTTDRSSTIIIERLDNIVSVCAGTGLSVAITRSGELYF
jgi:alpha-tubulin suppressor-like RCC1 family protein